MSNIELLNDGFNWTIARVAAVKADHVKNPTPCSLWNLGELLDHTVESLGMVTNAVAGNSSATSETNSGANEWTRSITALATRSRNAWRSPGVMDRSFELPFGVMSATDMASTTLLEVVVHGWDISQGTGEAAEIPNVLALSILATARRPEVYANRGNNFANELSAGFSASEQLVAFLGRKPL